MAVLPAHFLLVTLLHKLVSQLGGTCAIYAVILPNLRISSPYYWYIYISIFCKFLVIRIRFRTSLHTFRDVTVFREKSIVQLFSFSIFFLSISLPFKPFPSGGSNSPPQPPSTCRVITIHGHGWTDPWGIVWVLPRLKRKCIRAARPPTKIVAFLQTIGQNQYKSGYSEKNYLNLYAFWRFLTNLTPKLSCCLSVWTNFPHSGPPLPPNPSYYFLHPELPYHYRLDPHLIFPWLVWEGEWNSPNQFCPSLVIIC